MRPDETPRWLYEVLRLNNEAARASRQAGPDILRPPRSFSARSCASISAAFSAVSSAGRGSPPQLQRLQLQGAYKI